MESNIGELCFEKISLFFYWFEEVICKSNCSNVFHTTDSEFGHENLVVLTEGELALEEVLEESDAGRHNLEQLRGIHIGCLALPYKDFHWHLLLRVLIFKDLKWTSK
jgi:hypothetical protein